MKIFSALIMIPMMIAIQSAWAQNSNLVQNGDFEEGNTGFKSDFRYYPNETFNNLIVKGCYTILDNFPFQVNRFLNHFIDNNDAYNNPTAEASARSAATGDFLAVNVNESGKLWYDSITIEPNTIYHFSCIVANIYFTPPLTISVFSGFGPYNTNIAGRNIRACPGDITLRVNGKKVSEVLKLKYDNEWKTLSGTFTSGSDQTRIEISIYDHPWSKNKSSKAAWSGAVHYVAVDNIVFKKIRSLKRPPVKKDTAKIVAGRIDFKRNITIDEIKVDQKLKLSYIYFERAEYNLLAASLPQLNDLADFMKKNPGIRIRLEGHTDNQGDAKLNVELSENRVKEVKKYLVEQGIEENRIEWIGYGGQRPVSSNFTEALRSKNRRVEVVILSK